VERTWRLTNPTGLSQSFLQKGEGFLGYAAMMPGGGATKMPFSVRALTWVFVTNPHHDLFRRAATRALGLR